MRILYVEDSRSLRDTVARGLRKAGFTVDVAEDGAAGLEAAFGAVYAVIILDVMLPKVHGFEILRQLRAEKVESQILMLTARVAVVDRVAGLEAGADDYLVKPFAWEELVARVRALVRRRFDTQTNSVALGALTVDLLARRVWADGEELELRPREFGILEYLALRAGQIVTRTEILEEVYDHSVDLKSNAIDAAICNLRRKLTEVGFEESIRTVPRRGYMIETQLVRTQHGKV